MTIEPLLALSHLLKISLSCYLSLSFSQTHTHTISLTVPLYISRFFSLSPFLSLALSPSLSLTLFNSYALTGSLALDITATFFTNLSEMALYLSISLSLIVASFYLYLIQLLEASKPHVFPFADQTVPSIHLSLTLSLSFSVPLSLTHCSIFNLPLRSLSLYHQLCQTVHSL